MDGLANHRRTQADPTVTETAAPAPEPPASSTLIALQSTAGNRAVCSALARDGPLPRLEQAFDADFSDVRVHADSAAAQQLGARAFARGAELHFAPGEYRPGDRGAGDELIAHELAHVVQQRQRRAGPGVRLTAGASVDVDPALETEAWEQARRAMAGRPARPGGIHSAPAPTRGVIQGAFTVSATVTGISSLA